MWPLLLRSDLLPRILRRVVDVVETAAVVPDHCCWRSGGCRSPRSSEVSVLGGGMVGSAISGAWMFAQPAPPPDVGSLTDRRAIRTRANARTRSSDPGRSGICPWLCPCQAWLLGDCPRSRPRPRRQAAVGRRAGVGMFFAGADPRGSLVGTECCAGSRARPVAGPCCIIPSLLIAQSGAVALARRRAPGMGC